MISNKVKRSIGVFQQWTMRPKVARVATLVFGIIVIVIAAFHIRAHTLNLSNLLLLLIGLLCVWMFVTDDLEHGTTSPESPSATH